MTHDEELFEALVLGIQKGELEAICPECEKNIETHRDNANMCNGKFVDLERVIFRVPDSPAPTELN